MTDSPNTNHNPAPLDLLKTMSGLEFLSAIRDGKLPGPPIAQLLCFALIEVGDGLAVFEGQPNATHYNPIGTVHGGYAATMLDSCMACAVQSKLPRGIGYTTLEIKVNLVRAITVSTGRVRAEGRVLTSGRRIATSEGRLLDAAGKLLAHGTTTCLVMDLEQA